MKFQNIEDVMFVTYQNGKFYDNPRKNGRCFTCKELFKPKEEKHIHLTNVRSIKNCEKYIFFRATTFCKRCHPFFKFEKSIKTEEDVSVDMHYVETWV